MLDLADLLIEQSRLRNNSIFEILYCLFGQIFIILRAFSKKLANIIIFQPVQKTVDRNGSQILLLVFRSVHESR